MLSLALLSNAFIIFYSCLSENETKKWNTPFTNFFASLVNTFTNKPQEAIKLEGIETHLSDVESYEYNYIPGYKVNEIPLGSAKQIETSFSPNNATNQSITYTANPSENVILNQSGPKVSIIGMKAGNCLITSRSNDGNFESSVEVKILEPLAPVSYEISLDKTTIEIGKTQTINFDIDGGILTHDELINFRYYDIRKLSYSSSDESVATVDTNGVIYPVNVGITTIKVSNGDFNRSINVTITSGSIPPMYSDLSISGSKVCYADDMIHDQTSKKSHYQLVPTDNGVELDPEDFIWESSNELLVRVDKHGIMRGFRKASNEDENAIITAKSKLTGQTVTHNIMVKNSIPMRMNYYINTGGDNIWDEPTYTFCVGDNPYLYIYYDLGNVSRRMDIAISDESVISFTNEGNRVVLHALKEGECSVYIASVLNKDLTASFTCKVMKAGALATKDLESFGKYIRKSLGHAFVFMVAQVFTYLTFYMFFYDKKWWFYSSISLGEGLFIAGLSELIQFFVPSRSGAFLDVLIDFAGVVVGAALTFLGISIVKKIKEKKSQKETSKNN